MRKARFAQQPGPDGLPRPRSPFWDVIAITATDEAQASSYRQQLTRKRANREIPQGEYYVFPDPPGPKIGNVRGPCIQANPSRAPRMFLTCTGCVQF